VAVAGWQWQWLGGIVVALAAGSVLLFYHRDMSGKPYHCVMFYRSKRRAFFDQTQANTPKKMHKKQL
jgi:cell division protein FtsW (lipid II flippase)